jgi:uncharacterized LabA/DUF88 family protein
MSLDRDDSKAVALYWDFENLHAGLCDERFGEGSYAKPDNRFKPQEPLVDVQAVVEMAASFGRIAINRAYCNWQFFGRYRDAMLQAAVELIQLFPPGGSAKNGADIKLCLDATEDIGRFAHIGTVVIVGGDSDFMPVSQKIKAAGRTLVGLGTRRSTNRHWAKSCHEFRYYESLVDSLQLEPAPGLVEQQPGIGELAPTAAHNGAELLRRAVQLLADAKGEPWINKATVCHMIKRLDPTFMPKDHGYVSFSAMVNAMDSLVEVRKGTFDQEVKLRE